MRRRSNLILLGLIGLLMSVCAEAQVNQKQDNSKLLHEAVTNGDFQEVLLAIKRGANVNAVKYVGSMNYSWTPLHEAVAKGYVEIEKVLIENGANVNAKNNFGWSVLHEAAGRSKNVKLAQLLVENGANVNIKNNGGETPLKYAVASGNVEVARILIENGAEVNLSARDGAGNTLMDYAEKYARSEEMKALLLMTLEKSVKFQGNDAQNKESVQAIGVITGNGVRLRSSMDTTTKANIIDKFPKDTRVEILERNGEWLKVRVNGKEGYMFAEFVDY